MLVQDEEWTLADIARESGLDLRAVESRMRRTGLEPVRRRLGRGGAYVWAADAVRREWAARRWLELPEDRQENAPDDLPLPPDPAGGDGP